MNSGLDYSCVCALFFIVSSLLLEHQDLAKEVRETLAGTVFVR